MYACAYIFQGERKTDTRAEYGREINGGGAEKKSTART